MAINLVLMGLPGAGKGTQAQKIEANYSMLHISTGDIFRNAIKNQTEMGKQAQKYIDKGELVPDEVTDGIVADRLNQKDIYNNGFMLDGYPRNLEQAKALQKLLTDTNRHLDAVINIDVDPDILVKRLSARYICKKCGATYNKISNPTKKAGVCDFCGSEEFYQRDDDKPETVKNRLDVNNKMNTPLIDFYKEQNILYNINGDQDIDQVFKEIIQVLDNLSN